MKTPKVFNSNSLLLEEQLLVFSNLDVIGAIELGEIAKLIGLLRNLPIAVEVRLSDWLSTMHPCQGRQLKINGGLIEKLEL